MPELEKDINFIHISHGDSMLFEYQPHNCFKCYALDLNIIKKLKIDDIFFHLHRGNSKIVYIKKDNLFYSIATEKTDIQYQVLEAIIEKVIAEFNESYDIEVILSYGDINANIFSSFKAIMTNILKDFYSLDLIREVDAYCRICSKTHYLHVKKSFIENSESFPVPLVYTHSGHSIMCYIDKQFQVRGVELVHITG